MKRMCSGKSSNIRSSNTSMDSLKFVKSAQSKSALSSPFRVEKAKNMAKTASARSDLSAPKVSEKTTEKSTSEQLKSNSSQGIKIVLDKSCILEKVLNKTKSKTIKGITPTTDSSRKSAPNRNTVSKLCTRAQQFHIPLRSSNTVTSRMYRSSGSGVFHYHLSHLEESRFGQSRVFPMKSVPAAELQLLRNGQRISYLERRYERSPDDKYNYPEATSWRYGWFHRESDPFQKRVPRRD
ncbi:uncharacterized protein LOC108144258 [Drosophila elegans]|uniref:uncharacterized protein LOC108144258 n=1 Tax=Drosophila elegans TaxID=30023 RepID=UPI0007E79F55|nr:uncharacterized protein LOC108144258 [Drosophila elegans]